MRYQVFIIIFLVMIISLSAMNSEYVTRFSESNTSFRLKNMVIDNGRLYLCKEYGIDIFSILDNGELELLNTLELDDINSFSVEGNNLYFIYFRYGGYPNECRIHYYDISNIYFPVEINQCDLEYIPRGIHIWHDMLALLDFVENEQVIYYDLETLEYIGCLEEELILPLHDEYWCSYHPDHLNIYDLSDPFDAQVVTTVNLSVIGNDYNHICKRINPELYVIFSQHEMSFWNTSDFSNWQLISQFPFPDLDHLFYGLNIEIWDNKIILPLLEELLVVDINNPALPQVSQLLNYVLFNPTNCLKYGEKLYLVDNYVGINIFDITDNGIVASEVCTEFPKMIKGLVKDDYIIRETWVKNATIPDMNIWDISTPDQPVLAEEVSLGEYKFSYNLIGDVMVLKNGENLCVELYDVSNLPEIQYINSINYFNNEYEFMYGSIYVFDDDINSLYLKKNSGIFTCYDISNPEEPEYLFEITEEDYFIINKQGDYIYLCESSNSDERDLKIYSGIDSNNPQLAAYYPNFMPDYFHLEILDNKLFISHSYDGYTTQVYYLNGAEMPEFVCNLYSDCSGKVYSYENEYMVCSLHDINIFTIPENPPEYLEPICHIGRFNFVNDVEVIHCGTEDYLYIFDQAYTEVYQIESTHNDEDLITESIQIIPYPNPFSFTDTQNISFLPAGDCRNLNSETKLSIYNIKGQLLHNEYFQPGRNSFTWNGLQYNGRKSPSGVYLYKIDAGNNSSAGKFIITK